MLKTGHVCLASTVKGILSPYLMPCPSASQWVLPSWLWYQSDPGIEKNDCSHFLGTGFNLPLPNFLSLLGTLLSCHRILHSVSPLPCNNLSVLSLAKVSSCLVPSEEWDFAGTTDARIICVEEWKFSSWWSKDLEMTALLNDGVWGKWQ